MINNDKDLELIPDDVRYDKTVTQYTRLNTSNMIEFRFVKEQNTLDWQRVPQSVIKELNAERKSTRPLETDEERRERLEKSRLRREAKEQEESDYEDLLEFEDFDNDIEIAKAEELLRLLKAQEENDIRDWED